jgi:kynurenine--oxoglutarate transaminase/cysteine-S-conjugate beta-lyase/glutamine--phenylpyruvate transaminase
MKSLNAITLFTLLVSAGAFSTVPSTPQTRHPIHRTRRAKVSLRERVWDSSSTGQSGKDQDVPKVAGSSPPSNLASGGAGQATLRLGASTPTVWTEFSRLAQEHPVVVNLGQGFPDWLPPKFAIDSLVEAALDSAQSPHQYTRPAGHPNLVRKLATRYGKHMRRDVDPFTEVAVTVGASQALYLSLQTIIQPGDEVILFEPFFDLYVSQVKLAGGTPVFVPLTFVPYEDDTETVVTGGDWVLEADKLKQAVTTRTKAILLNSPHNPTGKIFTRDEMEMVAEALELANPDCVVLSDEVYKYIVHSPPKERASEESLFCRGHVHFASLPGMWDRTITISSAGKTFSATGWQVGWCVGPNHLIARIHQLLPYVQFCASTVIQEALARSLTRADEPYEGHASYYDFLRHTYTRKRDLLASALIDAGFAVPDYDRTAGGGFFILARIGPKILSSLPESRINVPNDAAPNGEARQDWALCQWMAEQDSGVLCIPSSPFFSSLRVAEGVSDEFVRVAFCKTDDTIDAAAKALQTLANAQSKKSLVNDSPSAHVQESPRR